MFPPDIQDLARQIIRRYTEQKHRIVTAESCTGGMIATALTDVPGSSEVFERGFITYSDEAKVDLLGVLPDVLETYGAVSAEVADAMAEGALTYSQADIAVSVTGIAGPGGATPGKPVGLVYIGIATRSGSRFHYRSVFRGNRDAVRLQATYEALKLLLSAVEKD